MTLELLAHAMGFADVGVSSTIRPPAGSSGLAADADPARIQRCVAVRRPRTLPLLRGRRGSEALRLHVIHERSTDCRPPSSSMAAGLASATHALRVEHHHAARQRVEQQSRDGVTAPPSPRTGAQLAVGDRQLRSETGHLLLAGPGRRSASCAEASIEQRESLLQLLRARAVSRDWAPAAVVEASRLGWPQHTLPARAAEGSPAHGLTLRGGGC